jgi:hypothetical protein
MDAERLVARLRELAWWGQITGPHGSGKSTLLRTLVPCLEQAGRRVEFYTLPQAARVNPFSADRTRPWTCATQIVVDGYEQLGWFRRTWLRRQCRVRRAGLLATAHRPVGLPQLWSTKTDRELARRLVDRLLPAAGKRWISGQDVDRAFAEHRGDMRETLFALYDVFEARVAEPWD